VLEGEGVDGNIDVHRRGKETSPIATVRWFCGWWLIGPVLATPVDIRRISHGFKRVGKDRETVTFRNMPI
jgi:hypothetical protein